MSVPKNKWEWFGFAGHLCIGHMCRFHLCTQVGKYLVSTVGDYHCSLDQENGKAREIGCDRLYETMVFKAGKPCDIKECGCRQPELETASGLDMEGYNTGGEAQRGHMKMCAKWARETK